MVTTIQVLTHTIKVEIVLNIVDRNLAKKLITPQLTIPRDPGLGLTAAGFVHIAAIVGNVA